MKETCNVFLSVFAICMRVGASRIKSSVCLKNLIDKSKDHKNVSKLNIIIFHICLRLFWLLIHYVEPCQEMEGRYYYRKRKRKRSNMVFKEECFRSNLYLIQNEFLYQILSYHFYVCVKLVNLWMAHVMWQCILGKHAWRKR